MGQDPAAQLEHSLFEEALCEADRFKWVLSEQYHCDVGPWGRAEWVRRYWPVFLRWKRIEHLIGLRRYVEFDAESFGVLQPLQATQGQLVEFVVRQVTEELWENLDFLCRSSAESYCRVELLEVLRVMGINSLRISPPAWGVAA
jgi:hypothetical protein